MPAPVAALVVFATALAALCLPPAALMQMLARRRFLDLHDLRLLYRGGFYATGMILLFNLLVALFATPWLGGRPLGTLHLVALGLSWICFLAAVALGALVRRRRNSAI